MVSLVAPIFISFKGLTTLEPQYYTTATASVVWLTYNVRTYVLVKLPRKQVSTVVSN
jgi:hypothetical protein